jgi:hypothetical protein
MKLRETLNLGLRSFHPGIVIPEWNLFKRIFKKPGMSKNKIWTHTRFCIKILIIFVITFLWSLKNRKWQMKTKY